MIRCKFRLIEWKNSEGSKRVGDKVVSCIKTSVVLIPVADSSPENKAFWEATPSGRIELGIVNPKAIKELKLMKEYYVDFTEVPESAHG